LDLGPAAPGEELRIVLDPLHEREHPFGGVRNQDGLSDSVRRACGHRQGRIGSGAAKRPKSARIVKMSIAQNKKALHDYFIEERFEAGLVLEGWEVKAIRAGRAQLKEGYVVIRNGELFLIGAHITALPEASTHIKPDPTRT